MLCSFSFFIIIRKYKILTTLFCYWRIADYYAGITLYGRRGAELVMRESKKRIMVIILLISLLLNIYMIIKYCRINSLNENIKIVRSNIKEWEKYE